MSGPLETGAGAGFLPAGEYGEHVRAREKPGCGNLVTEAVLYRYACLSSNTPA